MIYMVFMNINFNCFSNCEFFSIKNFKSVLTIQQKKIFLVVSVALGLLATCYLIYLKMMKTSRNGVSHIKVLGIKKDKNPKLEIEKDKKQDEQEQMISHLVIDQLGIINGIGERYYENGDYAQGTFRNGKLNGKGELICTGVKFVGDFQDGLLHGQGKITYSDGSYREGCFKNGKLHGQGVCINQPCSLYTGLAFEGIFHENVLTNGKITFDDGEVREGEFKRNLLHGKGKQILPDGIIREGIFDHNNLDGLGKISFPDGMSYITQFKKGIILDGKGEIVLPNGLVYEAMFENNQFISMSKYPKT